MKTAVYKKNIVLGVSGGIAAYKSVELLRNLVKLDANVKVIMTRNASRFVGPMTFETLSKNKVCTGLFNDKDDAGVRHIEWAQQADAVVVAPATANFVGKLANGIADDALLTFMLAVTCPTIICPSMNSDMYEHPSVQKNLKVLKEQGNLVLSPSEGDLACGVVGTGRLPEPGEITDRILNWLTPDDLKGQKVLVTAGPTQEAIDPVRFISNPSSGKMGYAIAKVAEYRGADVTLVTGPCSIKPPVNVNTVNVTSVSQMAEAVFEQMDAADIIIKVAAVSDYKPKQTAAHKIKKTDEQMVLTLEKTTDILREIGKRKKDQVVVGFAAETRDLDKNAGQKLVQKNLDMIAANLIGPADSGFGSDTNRMSLFFKDGQKKVLDLMDKEMAASAIIDEVLKIIKAK